MEFLGNLGINVWLLLAQVVNFSVLLIILTKFVYKPIIARIEKDEKDLSLVRSERDTLTKKETQLDKKEVQQVIRAKKRAKVIIEEAEQIADEIRERAQHETEKEKEAVVAQIKQRLNELSCEQNPQ